MRFLWDLKVYSMADGFRVVIAGGGKTVTGNGPSVATAFRAAEVQLVEKPPFEPSEFMPGVDLVQVQP